MKKWNKVHLEKGMGQPSRGSVLFLLERQVLAFPLLVVLLACGAFLFGGRCAAWQWWTAVLFVTGTPFLRRNHWKEAVGACGLFFALLLAVKCLLPPLFWDHTANNADMRFYHLPMIQLLIEGWNPVVDPLAKGIASHLGLDLWGMAPLHVAFLSKTMAVFAAVAYKFVGDPTSLTLPGLFFLWAGVALQASRQFTGITRWAALVALIFLLPQVPKRMPVDVEMAIASCGLLLALKAGLEKKRCDWLALTAWGAWMMNLKLQGVAGAFVFCALFTVVKCWKEREEWQRWVGRFSVWLGVLTILWGVVSWNPLMTSWTRYGHPLYPFKTVNPERFPVKDFIWDAIGNKDAQTMGRVGALAHAYLSPRATEAFYRWWLGRNEFKPHREWWEWGNYPTPMARVAIWILFGVLFVLPSGRLWGLGGLILLVIYPSGLTGYLRYQAWLSALGCLAVVLAAEWLERRTGKCSLRYWRTIATCAGLVLLAGWMWKHARDVSFKAAELDAKRTMVRWCFYPGSWNPSKLPEREKFVARYDWRTAMENTCRLLVKELGWEGRTHVVSIDGWQPMEPGQMSKAARPLWQWDERQWYADAGKRDERTIMEVGTPWREGNIWDEAGKSPGKNDWVMTPWRLYYVPYDGDAAHVVSYWRGAERCGEESLLGYGLRRLDMVVRAWGVTYPLEIWHWLQGHGLGK